MGDSEKHGVVITPDIIKKESFYDQKRCQRNN
jgi:hypothetical protein